MTLLPSVTIPRVPSAPINSFVVSNPAADFRALLRVLITSPDGRTAVCEVLGVESKTKRINERH
jgi:hypothetical protein